MDSDWIRFGISFAGILLMVVSFVMHSYKKITVNYTVIWELLGLALLLTGVVPVFSQWTRQLASGTGLAFFCVGAIFLFEEFRTSAMISQLILRERENGYACGLAQPGKRGDPERTGKSEQDGGGGT